MKHAGGQDPGDAFDEIFSGSADRITNAGGTPLTNDTARSDDEEEDSNGEDT